MTRLVKAWRDSTGRPGVDVGTLAAHGYDNVVTEESLDGDEIEALVVELHEAYARAVVLAPGEREEMPGPYDDEWYR